MRRAKTATFLIELPLAADSVQTSHLRAHLEAGWCLYNALLSEARTRLRKMRSGPEWQAACAIPRTHKQDRSQAFSHVRQKYQFSEYALHDYAKRVRVSWIADHIDYT